jgi:glycosyltransferase involved in cell wall biosynthesis
MGVPSMSDYTILWVGDAVTQTGFARVTHSVLDPLAELGTFDIHVLGINHFGDPYDYDYKIWPARLGGDVLGYNRLSDLVNRVKPNLVVLFNDIWVVNNWIKILMDMEYSGSVMTYFPVDSTGFNPDWIRNLYALEKVLVYTEFGKRVIRDAGFKGEVHVVPHGIDTEIFFPIPTEEARSQLSGLGMDDFIVFNGNRNQPRKRIDITVKAFMQFVKDKPDVRLYLHMGMDDLGWDLISLFHREAKKHNIKDAWERLVLTSPDLGPSNAVTVDTLNVIYNTANVGVNTSLGEGWGLVNFEQSACGVPQVVPNFSACGELYEGRGLTVDPFYNLTAQKINTEGGLVHEDDVAAALDTYYYDEELRHEHAALMYDYIKQPKFDWTNIAQQWHDLMIEALET